MRFPKLLLFALLISRPALAQPQCMPCVGIAVDSPAAATASLAAVGGLEEGQTLVVKWRVELDDTSAAELAGRLADHGALPWIAVSFRTPSPVLANVVELNRELEALAVLARQAGEGVHFQLLWDQLASSADPAPDYAFLVKRAAVAITGAEPTARVFSAPLAADESLLSALYAEELAAYLDGIALAEAPATQVERMAALLQQLDPGAAVVIDAVPFPADPLQTLTAASSYATAGSSLTLFRLARPDAEELRPLLLLAREFAGDLALDPYSVPAGGSAAWSFVRGSDLELRVVVERPAEAAGEVLTLRFPDRHLTSPSIYDPATGEAESLYSARRREDDFEVDIIDPPPVLLLGLRRLLGGQLEGEEGIEETLRVDDTRQMPVEEIIRRLQAFEDAQARRLLTYRATNTTHLRFQFGTATRSLETTFAGDFFFRQGGGFDWAWQSFYFNGVRWRKKTIPRLPLIQPERAASLPLEVTFSKDYRYQLRGTAEVAGRECWVVDFRPNVRVEPGRSLHQGTVWIDRELFSRVRTRAVQLGLDGDVISSEETIHYTPVDARGLPSAWLPTSYWLPTRVVGQQLWSLLDATIVVERETLLSEVDINPAEFESELAEVQASEATMIRDTEEGMRYLVVDKETGQRIVQEKPDSNRLFLLGGVFFDESLDYPVPLGGVNWLSFDFKGTGTQANVFFAGALATVDIASPRFLGSKFNAGVDLVATAFAGTDTVFKDGVEVEAEDVKRRSPNVDFALGRPIGNFFKLDFEYSLAFNTFSRADDTAPGFVLPSDHFSHSFSLTTQYNRAGYRFRAVAGTTLRERWEPWGLPGSSDFDPDDEQFYTWRAALAKTWHLPDFRKLGAEVEYVDGEQLDRFSKYGFGFFSSIRVHGYQGGKVRAESALASHLSYGFDLGELLRLDFLADTAWATDREAAFDREFLAGAGVAGTIVGPWGTLVQLDLGVALAGPDDGISVFLAFLKLFPGKY